MQSVAYRVALLPRPIQEDIPKSVKVEKEVLKLEHCGQFALIYAMSFI